MFIDPTLVTGAIVLLLVAYQQWCILRLDRDIDELTDRHNNFVETVASVFEAIEEASDAMEADQT
mgnify:FL=1|jgi:hypothetical protein|tara:strand:+ start:621 stop:815 length:195 start_codon:yes stop_codon:yes gene_type:complete